MLSQLEISAWGREATRLPNLATTCEQADFHRSQVLDSKERISEMKKLQLIVGCCGSLFSDFIIVYVE